MAPTVGESMRILALIVLAAVLAGCSSEMQRPDPALAAQPTPARLDPGLLLPTGTQLTWGGLVQSVTNLPHSTELEVLSYPLNARHRPITSLPSSGRFLVRMKGFVEPRRYPMGTAVTATGPLIDWAQRTVGQASLRLPVLRGVRLDAWPTKADRNGNPSVGVGLGLSNYGGSIGVGFGF